MLPKVNNIPKVSVIIPTYNRAHLIGRAIKSVLNQSYRDFEVIVVDDGSTDNTNEVIKSFVDERIKYYYHKKNKGYPEALNTGLNLARGSFIAFQDDDDEWFTKKLYKQMMIFKKVNQNVGVVYSGFWKIKNDEKIYLPSSCVTKKEGYIHYEILKGNFIGMPTSIVRRECFDKVGMFDTTISYLQDWELWIKISKYYEFKYLSEPLMISHYTPNSVNVRSSIIQAETMKLILSKHYEDFSKDKKILSMYYFSIANNLYLNANFKNAKEYFVKTVKTNPLNIKYLLALIISFFGQSTYDKAVKIYRKIKSYNFYTKE